MHSVIRTNQLPGLSAGILVGLAIAYLWPHEAAYATTGDRAPHFSMVTMPVSDAANGIVNPLDGVFVLDFVTGQLRGAVINRQTAQFASFHFRDLGKEFDVPAGRDPEFCMVTGHAQTPNRAGQQMASGMIYIGELHTGLVRAYSFPWVEKGMKKPIEMTPIDSFSWKRDMN